MRLGDLVGELNSRSFLEGKDKRVLDAAKMKEHTPLACRLASILGHTVVFYLLPSYP